jgi:hypothetical protein
VTSLNRWASCRLRTHGESLHSKITMKVMEMHTRVALLSLASVIFSLAATFLLQADSTLAGLHTDYWAWVLLVVALCLISVGGTLHDAFHVHSGDSTSPL